MSESVTEYEARQILHDAGIEAGENTKTYVEIARFFHLIPEPEITEQSLPEPESKV
jgi:hypothetical protein